MNKIKLRNYTINLITLIISTLICLLIINFILITISPKKIFPRSLAGSLPNVLLTFYANTYDHSNFNKYTAILGDSAAQGGGDAYLSGLEDYSISHHLHLNDKKNYLIFARAGHGSISTASNLIKVQKLTKLSYLINDLDKPESIIFVFNEGRNLQANILEYKEFVKEDEKISAYTKRRINTNIHLNYSDKIINSFPILYFISEIYDDFENLFKKIFAKGGIKQIKSLITLRIKKLLGYTVILGDAQKDELTWTNSIKNNKKIKNIRPIQGAAIHLSDLEISVALKIFFESVKYIKNWSKINNIYIVYLPSTITSYEWNEPIVFFHRNYYEGKKTTTNKRNNLNSILIRNKIKIFSQKNNIKFIDTTDNIIEKGKNTVLHGPLDWAHFNYTGYKIISKYIIENR